MPKTDQDTKQKRIELVYRLLERHPNGLTEQEIADALNMDRRSVNNYLRELEIQGKLYKEGRLWIVLPYQRTRLRRFELSPEEAMTLYLATRLLVKQHDKRNESAETALVKLAEVLTGDVGVGQEIHQAALELAQRPGDESYSRVFRTVMQSYIYRRQVSITYEPLNSPSFQTVLSPYLLEPSAIGYATYVIGHSSIVNALRTYKLERIRQATLTRQEYAIPPDFPGLDHLRNAWSIITGDDLIPVKLRFSPGLAARRVRESQWHPSQAISDDPDHPGGCIWTAHIGDLTDFIPWVRGWGADVEVIGPEGLREALKKEAQQLAVLYEIGEIAPLSSHRLLWGKADRKTGSIHRLLYHLIDVGQVASALWQKLDDTTRQQLADWLGLNVEEAGQFIAFLASLHDLGKASPAFQDHRFLPFRLKNELKRDLEMVGLSFPERGQADRHAHHAVVSTWTLDSTYENLLATEAGLAPEWAKPIAQALGGHHGAWPASHKFNSANLKQPDDVGQAEWTTARRELIRELKAIFKPVLPTTQPVNETTDNVMLTWLSAIVSVADWLGSDEKNFDHEDQVVPLPIYARYSKKLAECALLKAGWTGIPAERQPFDFQTAFGFDASVMQQEAIAAAAGLDLPALVILEAPTGSGKTEAALGIYAAWAKAADLHGLYVAMPTTATSNQMHKRARTFLKQRYGETVEPLLVHSQALLRDDMPIDQVDQIEEEGEEDHVAARTWFLPRKKSLLAPFGVGTVDQALMSVLQTKHFFVRLLGLSHKVVIFDEVHAYDVYMTTLFQRLLRWLREIGTSVIILSATLPEKTRRELVKAYTYREIPLPSADYPRLTYATVAGEANAVELSWSSERLLALEWMSRDPAEIVNRLRDELRAGGCAAVICNTVGRAQEVYEVLEQANQEDRLCDDDDLILFHARYPLVWREGIEQKVLDKFGKERSKGPRPERAIVVATQVIEQSLDLDFDVMISDIAPVDFLLQRAGRLHRHTKDAQGQTVKRHHPDRLLVTLPDESKPVPVFDRGEVAVYERYILLRTWAVLRHREEPIRLPNDLTTLIEAVYPGDGVLPNVGPEMQAALKAAKQETDKDEDDERYKARKRVVRQPDDEDLLWGDNLALEEDDPRVHETFQALTRSDRPGLSVVCLHQVGDRLMLEPEGDSLAFDPDARLSRQMIRELARHAVTIRRREVEKYFLAEPASPVVNQIRAHWKKIPALRYHRVAIFTDKVCKLEGTPYALRLTRKLGLEIRKEPL